MSTVSNGLDALLFESWGKFHPAYIKLPFDERVAVMEKCFERCAQSFAGLISLTAPRDTDPQAYEVAAKRALDVNPENISALRALSWHLERKKEFQEANDCISKLIKLNSGGDCVREVFRNCFVAGATTGDISIQKNEPKRKGEVSVSSYEVQFAAQAKKDGVQSLFRRLENQVSTALSSAIYKDVFLVDDESARRLSDIVRKWATAESVAIVGNGPNLKGAAKGPEIDSSEFVIRINYPKIGGYAEDAGSRTDLVLFYEGFRSKIESDEQLGAQYAGVNGLGVTTLHLPNAKDFREDDLRPMLPLSVVNTVTDLTYERATTGFLAAVLSAQVFRRKTKMYGFTFYQGGGNAYYFGANTNVFIGHELDYEYWYCCKYLKGMLGDCFEVVGLPA